MSSSNSQILGTWGLLYIDVYLFFAGYCTDIGNCMCVFGMKALSCDVGVVKCNVWSEIKVYSDVIVTKNVVICRNQFLFW